MILKFKKYGNSWYEEMEASIPGGKESRLNLLKFRTWFLTWVFK